MTKQQASAGTNMVEIKKGSWSPEEDRKLVSYITNHGIWNWSQIPKFAGLARTGKSCRLRWVNYLRPGVKRGPFTREEVEIIIKMYQSMGNRWSAMAAQLPGRSDNEIKNFFHTRLKKHLRRRKANHVAAPAPAPAASDRRSKDTNNNTSSDDAKIAADYRTESNNGAVLAESVPRVVEKPEEEECNVLGSSSVVILESSQSWRVENDNGESAAAAAAFSWSETVMDMGRTMMMSACLDYDVNAFWYDVLMEAEYLNF